LVSVTHASCGMLVFEIAENGHCVRPCSEGHPACPMEQGAISQGVKRPENEAQHSPPPNTEAKNAGVVAPFLLRLYIYIYIYGL
jgi:hypothetical protein